MATVGDTPVTLESPLRRGPPGRASGAELESMVRDAKDSPLFRAVLEWLDGFVIVLNEQRQILVADESTAQQAGFEDPAKIIGGRPGDAFGCVHAEGGEDGCGTTRACEHCGALQAILASQRRDAPIDSECTLTLKGEDGPYTMRYRVRATRADREGFTLLVFQEARDDDAPVTLGDRLSDDRWSREVERYARIRKLGQGGMGQVFLVEDDRGRQFALKALRRSRADDGVHVARFRRESAVTLALDHPNVVRTHAVDETERGLLYMITEYCPGGAVSRWLQRRGPVATELLLHWMIGVARGLDHAWSEHRVVHRDIKPDNLLLGEHNHIKIADFGIARRTGMDDTRLTGTGLVVGSLHYMSPEQARGKHKQDCRADLYSMGATFFHLACGVTPFDGAGPTEILLAQLKKSPPPIRNYREDLPETLTECIYWMMNKAPRHRPKDPATLLVTLADIAEDLGVDPDMPPLTVDLPALDG
jgi:hypothetical protein